MGRKEEGARRFNPPPPQTNKKGDLAQVVLTQSNDSKVLMCIPCLSNWVI